MALISFDGTYKIFYFFLSYLIFFFNQFYFFSQEVNKISYFLVEIFLLFYVLALFKHFQNFLLLFFKSFRSNAIGEEVTVLIFTFTEFLFYVMLIIH